MVAVLKELKQLHDKMVMNPKNVDKMNECQKKAALRYLMLLKQKRYGKTKVRECAGEIKQLECLTKDDTSVPTLETEALFLTFLINAMEHREVATVYIPGAFTQSDTEVKAVHMKMECKMVDILMELDPKLYQKYITTENVKLVL